MPANKLFYSLQNQKSFLDDVLVFIKELKTTKEIDNPELFEKAIDVFKKHETFLLTVFNDIQLKRFENTLIELLIKCRNKKSKGKGYRDVIFEFETLILADWKFKEHFFTKQRVAQLDKMAECIYSARSLTEWKHINAIRLFVTYLNTLS